MSVRAYVPTTSSGLAAVAESGRIAAPVRAHAVTDALRAAWPDGDDEQWEYAALMAAADSSAGLRAPGHRPRRYVLAVDVAEALPVPGDDPTAVELAVDVPFRDVAAAHADTEDILDTEDIPDTGDTWASGDDEGPDLAWFARQEIRDLV